MVTTSGQRSHVYGRKCEVQRAPPRVRKRLWLVGPGDTLTEPEKLRRHLQC